ncbi:PAS domain S-box-containing protein [Gillisia mitskevichiae]|uniref:histidine kinase n=1 Tax=Gillisia mitskevichiae TaxID=270921 RepID=A0A495PT60_9FLAO|nr:PAS domain S-box protein [Gillisia mitskevichiae]RKS53166.1 PAS domain S-box-containing protein [Gillisia mitskevichiae]
MQNTLRQLLSTANDIICSINISGEFIWLNKSAKDYFGFSSSNPSKKNFLDELKEVDKPNFQALITQIQSKASKTLNFHPESSLRNGTAARNWTLTWNEEEKLLYCLANNIDKPFFLAENDRYHSLFNNSPYPKLIYSSESFRFLDANDRAFSTYGYSRKEFIEISIKDITTKEDFLNFAEDQKDLIQQNEPKHLGIYTHIKSDGGTLKIEISGQNFPLNNEPAIIITCLDVTEQLQKNSLEHLENEIMEKALEVETDLDSLFQYYIRSLEDIFPEIKATILKIEDNKIWNLASSLPESFKTAIQGVNIGPRVGSCGTAAFLKKTVITSDISTDILWEDFKSYALNVGLKACWSEPIFNSKKEVIATFANYFGTLREPSDIELKIFKRSAKLIGIIFENNEKSKDLKFKIEQFNYVNLATNDAIYEADFNLDTMEWGLSHQALFGHKLENTTQPISQWRLLVHPHDLKKNVILLSDFAEDPTKKHWHTKYRFKRADGTYSFVEDRAYGIRDKEGNLVRLIGVLRDISLNRLELLKKEVLTHFNTIFNRNNALKPALHEITKLLLDYGGFSISEIWLIDSSKTELNLYSTASNENGEVFYTSENIDTFKIGEGLPGLVWKKKKIIAWDYKDTIKHMVYRQSAIKAQIKKVMGVPLIRQGELIGVWICAESTDDNSTFDTTKHIGLDIAENLASEIHRKQLEEQLSHIFQLAPDIICTIDFEGKIKKINAAGCQLLEYSEEELLKMNYNELLNSSNTGIFNETAQTFYNNRDTYRNENRYITKSGKVLWLDWNCRASLEEGLIYTVVKDVTDNKKLRNLLDDASKMASVGSWELDLKNNSIYWSDITREILEAEKDYVPIKEDAINHYRKDLRKKIDQTISEAIKKGVSWDFEFPIITFKGKEKWVRSMGKSEYVNGRCIRLYGSFQDIHEQKSLELKLKDTLTEKKEILERINDAFFAVDKNFIVTYWNKTAEEILQTPKEIILGKNLWEIFADAVNLPSFSYYNESLSSGKSIHFEDFYEPVKSWLDISVYPSSTGLSVYFKDITQKKIAEEKIRITTQRLKDIAWQQSHSVRAPVARLMAIIDLIKNGNLNLAEKEELFTEILNSSEEIDVIIRDISEKTDTINFEK